MGVGVGWSECSRRAGKPWLALTTAAQVLHESLSLFQAHGAPDPRTFNRGDQRSRKREAGGEPPSSPSRTRQESSDGESGKGVGTQQDPAGWGRWSCVFLLSYLMAPSVGCSERVTCGGGGCAGQET